MCRKGQGKDSGYLAGHWLELKKRCKGGRNTGEKDLQKKREEVCISMHSSLGKRQQAESGLKLEELNSMVTGS